MKINARNWFHFAAISLLSQTVPFQNDSIIWCSHWAISPSFTFPPSSVVGKLSYDYQSTTEQIIWFFFPMIRGFPLFSHPVGTGSLLKLPLPSQTPNPEVLEKILIFFPLPSNYSACSFPLTSHNLRIYYFPSFAGLRIQTTLFKKKKIQHLASFQHTFIVQILKNSTSREFLH